MSSFIYGKDETRGVVSVEIDGSVATLYLLNGNIITKPNEFYIIYSDWAQDRIVLKGDLHYKFAKKYSDYTEYQQELNVARARGKDCFTVYNPKESFMVKSGVTYYKGLNPSDLNVLSFDIETTGLDPKNNKVLLISNTFRDCQGNENRVLFSLDEYNNEKEMIYAWCNFVRKCSPDVILGHNIFGFDLPFLRTRAEELPIGRNGEPAAFAKRSSEFRKDGSQTYEYTNVTVYGRELVDTFHLSIKYDTQRNYPSYKLKEIIKHEGLERKDRQYYDAVKIKDAFNNPEEWDKVKKYAEHDADDALKLFDLMIPAYFYFCQSIPKTLQQVINGASGAQINSFMVRSYISEGHSIPKSNDAVQYEGAISYGIPGIYKNVGKVDVASLYPSIILKENIYDRFKDPKGNFLKMVRYFTEERLRNKRLSKETGDRYFKDLEQAQKIIINSAYGFLGTSGLNFNSPSNAASVTRHGRSILERGIEWARSNGFTIVNADTDSFSFTTGEKFNNEWLNNKLSELNAVFEYGIVWENDGIYSDVIVVKAKNYVLKDAISGKLKTKGSALKATMKEPALIKVIDTVINMILEGKQNDIRAYYESVVRDCFYINSDTIRNWASKKTITKAVLSSERTNEKKIRDAITQSNVPAIEGDKIFVFFKDDDSLSLVENFNGNYSKPKLLGKLYNTIKVFETVLDLSEFKNYSLKRNYKELVESL